MKVTVLERTQLRFDVAVDDGPAPGSPVHAASCVVAFGDGWLIAQDDANHAAWWRPDGVRPLRLFPSDGADVYSEAAGTKKRKPDVECAVRLEEDGRERVLLLGSGSHKNRKRAALVELTPDGPTVVSASVPSLYERIRGALRVAPDELNLEGACALGRTVRFFQRGNKGDAEAVVNAAVDVDARAIVRAIERGAKVTSAHLGPVRRYDLGRLDWTPLGFTDADVLHDGRVVFAAAAEASATTYDDGEVAGSVIGVIDPGGDLAGMALVAGDGPAWKVEGIAVERAAGDLVELRCVTDRDDPDEPSEALRLQLDLAAEAR